MNNESLVKALEEIREQVQHLENLSLQEHFRLETIIDIALSSHTEQGEEMEKLFEEAKELVIKLLPPLKRGEDYDCDRLFNIIEQLYGNTIDPQPIIEQLKKEQGEEIKSAEEIWNAACQKTLQNISGILLKQESQEKATVKAGSQVARFLQIVGQDILKFPIPSFPASQFKSSQGMRWVKANERIPPFNGNPFFIKIEGSPFVASIRSHNVGKDVSYYFKLFGFDDENYDLDNIEWLDESSQGEVNEGKP